MEQVHDHLEMPELNQNFGTQTYEQQVVELSQAGERGILTEAGPGAVQHLVAWAEPLGGGAQPLGTGPRQQRILGAWPL